MDNRDVKKYWEQNAEAWTILSREGYDKSRNLMNSPAFFLLLPPLDGLKGLDLGCGEGYNTRLAASRGAKMQGVDISSTFIHYAREEEKKSSLGITYHTANAESLHFADGEFDFVMATMSLMDMANLPQVLQEVFRVLKFGGFFQFSITHPCFNRENQEWILNDAQQRIGVALYGDYFQKDLEFTEKWIFGAAPPELKSQFHPFEIPRFYRTLSEWFNLVIDAGFAITRIHEPYHDDDSLKLHPEEKDSRIMPFFLIFQCRKEKKSI